MALLISDRNKERVSMKTLKGMEYDKINLRENKHLAYTHVSIVCVLSP